MAKFFSPALGSAAGGLVRYAVTVGHARIVRAAVPHGTLAVHLSGCLFVGFFFGMAEGSVLLGPNARLLFMTGFCGAYTSFSTLILEIAQLLQNGAVLKSIFYISLSISAGLALF